MDLVEQDFERHFDAVRQLIQVSPDLVG